jgi:hypothetical protein
LTESARDEALRLAKTVGFQFEPDHGVNFAVGSEAALERLITLARQRPGWVWVPEKPTDEMYKAYDNSTPEEFWGEMLAAASKPEGTP